ncbi:hypothetical protein H4R18_001103 [Coemansia javaensis]|uniref:FAS1 domain-containing protein n=1 Tax=Coemansia javaensis TaxID=2761396 RepID=A0A9W8HG34_9FUNG|nr:hypothetical protein H4R18_001103 [Coemansia javaensis]
MRRQRLLLLLLLAAPLLLLLAAARGTDGEQDREPVTFVDLLSSSARFSGFLHTAQRLRMVLPLNRLRNATMFVPTNEAMERYWREHGQGAAQVAGSVYRGVSDAQAWYHVVGEGVLGAQDLARGAMVWESLSRPGPAAPAPAPGNSTAPGIMVKTQVADGGHVTINGVPVHTQTYTCAAGNVYLVGGMLEIPPTILELLQGMAPAASRDARHAYDAMEKLLAVAGWSDVLGGTAEPALAHTVWAFSNAAFSSLFAFAERAYLLHGAEFAADDDELRRIAVEDVRTVASRYVSPGAVSLLRLGEGTHTVRGFGRDAQLTVVMDEGGAAGSVDGQPIRQPDLVASNGVVHGIGEMRRPDGLAFSPQKALVGLNATAFVRLLKDAGLDSYIDGTRPDRRLTLLAPSNSAMRDVLDYDPDGDGDGDGMRRGPSAAAAAAAAAPRERLREWAQYHIVDGQYAVGDLARSDGSSALLRTMLAGAWTGRKAQVVKAQVEAGWRPLAGHVSFNGADNILPEPAVVGNTTIYLLSSPMPTPPGMVGALIQNLDLALFVAAMGASGTADEIQKRPGVTVLAPVASAFTSLDLVWSYLSLPGDSDARGDLGRLIKAHVLTRPVYSDEIPLHTGGSADVLAVETLNGNTVRLHRTPHGIVVEADQAEHPSLARGRAPADTAASRLSRIADSRGLRVSEPDMLLKTGVAHVLERGLMLPRNVDITHAKLLRGMRAHAFVDLLKRLNLTRVLEDPRAPPAGPGPGPGLDGDGDGDGTPPERIVGYSLLVPSDKSWAENAAYRELVRRDHGDSEAAPAADDDAGNPWRNSTTTDIVHYLDRLVRLHIIPVTEAAAGAGPVGDGDDDDDDGRLPANRLLLADRKSYPTLLEDVRLRAHEFASDRFSLQLEGAPFYQPPGGAPFVSVVTVVRSGIARTGAVFELDTLLRLPPVSPGGPGGWRQVAWSAAVWLTGIGMGSGLLGVSGYWVRQWWTRADYQSL